MKNGGKNKSVLSNIILFSINIGMKQLCKNMIKKLQCAIK